ncbi:MAG: LacI family transcriptional regulator [Acholeplasmataceae bacterium]|nr:LacI family transcriptional regulator [Acholeplasmataceae bacterium]
MANIKEVAKAAGVSSSTVSRVINDSPSISEETKIKVRNTIREMNYTPNLNAKALTNNKSYTVTLLVDVDDEKSFQNPFFYEVMHGIEKYVYHNEYSLIVANLNTKVKKSGVLDWLVKGRRTDGVILPSSILTTDIVEGLRRAKIPFVSLGEPEHVKSAVSWIDIDNRKGTELATYRFLANGKKTIAFIGLQSHELFNRRRHEGYIHALKQSDIPIDETLVVSCENTKENGELHMKRLLSGTKVPDAVICADNMLSFGVLKAILDHGLKVPEDISLISYDNRQTAELSYPSISTVNVDVFELGFRSAQLLFDQISHGKTADQGILISTVIEQRET